jgi:hypothetical protein
MLAVAPNMTVTVAYDNKGFTETVPHTDGSSDSVTQQQQQQEVSASI